MKTKFNRILSVIFCLAMLFVFCTVAFAASVGLDISLDSATAEVGNLPSTVSMTVGTTEPIEIMSFWGEAYSTDSRITISEIQGTNLASNTSTGRFAFMTMNETSVSYWATVVFDIPADLPVGTYTLGVRTIGTSKSDNSNPLSGVSEQSVVFTVEEAVVEPEDPDDPVIPDEPSTPVQPDAPAVDKKCDGGVNCPSFGFADVDQSKWYHEGIDFVVANGMMNGTGPNKFDPNGVTSRAMIVTILYRLEGQPAVSGANPFSDVNNGTWYTNAVVWAAENAIVGGYGNGKFGPNDAITREQLAKIMYNYAEYKGYDVSARASLASFSDAGKVSSWATKEMQWAVSVGLINGMGDGRVAPQGDAERCQVAAIFMRFCEKYVK